MEGVFNPLRILTLTNPSLFVKIVLFPATWPSGKARVCKTLITGPNPVVASRLGNSKETRSPSI